MTGILNLSKSNIMKKLLITACKRHSPAAGATQGYDRLHAIRYAAF